MNFAIDCLFTALLAALTRYFLALSRACLLVGRAISDTDSRTGLQGAVTPPWATNAALIVWLLSAILVGSQFWYRGFWYGLASAALFLGVMAIVGIGAMPKQTS